MQAYSTYPIIKVIEESYEIPQLGRKRRISALLPHDYEQTDKKYPVLYMQDGQNLFDDNSPFGNWAIDRSLEELAENGCNDIIVISIDHGGNERINEYMPFETFRFKNAQGKLYMDFFINRLKPYVDNKFRVKTDRINTGIGGSSMGGLISLFGGIAYPEIFGKMLIFSPSLWVSPKIFIHAEHFLPAYYTDMYIYAGGRESKAHFGNVLRLQSSLTKSRRNLSKLRLKFSINPDGSHQEIFWAREFPKAVKWLYFNKHKC
jgi:predicted alpha/beta superfamily hydrolase